MTLAIEIIVGLLLLILGFVLGNLFPVLFDRGVKKEAEPEVESESPAPSEEKAEPAPRPRLPDSRPGFMHLAHMWREDGSKELVAEIEGAMLKKDNDLTTEQHGLLSLLLVDLQNWVGLEARLKAAEAPKPVAARAKPEAPPKPPSLNPLEIVKKAVTADVRLPEKKLSMAAQIDAILQGQLANTPLDEHGIRILDQPGHALAFEVGLNTYSSIEEIPDEDVRAAIRAAVAEWDKLGEEPD